MCLLCISPCRHPVTLHYDSFLVILIWMFRVLVDLSLFEWVAAHAVEDLRAHILKLIEFPFFSY